MPKKHQKTNAERILDKENILHEELSYPVGKDHVDGISVARLIGKKPSEVFKTLVTVGSSKNYYVFVIPADSTLNLKKAAKSCGEKSVSMIEVKDINKVTGYIRGGCSPIGMKKPYPTYIDKSALTHDMIIISAGKIGYQIGIKAEDLSKLIDAKFTDLTM